MWAQLAFLPISLATSLLYTIIAHIAAYITCLTGDSLLVNATPITSTLPPSPTSRHKTQASLSSVLFRAHSGPARAHLERVLEDEIFAVDPLQDADLPMEEVRVLTRERMSVLTRERVLQAREVVDDALKLIACHEVLAAAGNPSLVYAFSVHFNLWGGSLLKLGSEEQMATWIPKVDAFHDGVASRGCFALTEVEHGVLSGMFLDTTATYDPEGEVFVIHTPGEGGVKNWISFAAAECPTAIVFAQLILANGENEGIHAFLVSIRGPDGSPAPGVSISHMGPKTCISGNDNARLSFDSVSVPRTALLSKFSQVAPDGTFTSSIEDVRKRFFVVSDQLISGRMCIAAAGSVLARVSLQASVAYAMTRIQSRGPSAPPSPILTLATHALALVPAIAQSYAMAMALNTVKKRYAAMVAEEGSGGVGNSPDRPWVTTWVCAFKSHSTEEAVRLSTLSRNAAGGAFLLATSGVSELADVALSLALVEGDSKVLAQKASKELLRHARKSAVGGDVGWMARSMATSAAHSAFFGMVAPFLAPTSLTLLRTLLAAKVNVVQLQLATRLAATPRAQMVAVWSGQLLDIVFAHTRAACTLFAFDEMAAAISRLEQESGPADDEDLSVPLLRSLLVLYALDAIVSDLGFFVAHTAVTSQLAASLQSAHKEISLSLVSDPNLVVFLSNASLA